MMVCFIHKTNGVMMNLFTLFTLFTRYIIEHSENVIMNNYSTVQKEMYSHQTTEYK